MEETMNQRFLKKLEKPYLLLDGAMGTMLQQNGMKTGAIPELLGITNTDLLIDIHKQYIRAGADVIYANTFSANRYKLANCGYSVQTVIEKAVSNARQASKELGDECLVALDIGPIGQLLEPTGSLSFEEAYDIFKEQVLAGKESDLIVFETMTDLLEIKAAILAAKENSDLPIFATMTFEENGRTFTGCSCQAMALTLEGLGVDAIGLNCSLGPKEIKPVIEEMAKWTNLPIIAKPNAGLPDPKTNTYDVTPNEFMTDMKALVENVRIFGGCCGTTPEYIKSLKEMLENYAFSEASLLSRTKKEIPTAVCSPTHTIVIDQPRIIGERINPTGKKRLKEALKNKEMSYILNQAMEQVHAGAEILDVNVGLPGIDEKEMMVQVVKELQGIVDVPLQIDSTIPQVLEAALRVYAGKPIINSVNGEEESLQAVLPLAKKYGAAVIGLTLDEDGIPKTAEKRLEIAEKIIKRAQKLGIAKENIFIDCLTLTASAEQENVMETLDAVYRVKKEFGCKTVLGVSNISFGLPNRELINHTFLTMALHSGLDLPIINPNIAAMSGSVRAFRLLKGYDVNSIDYIAAYQGVKLQTTAITETKKETETKQKESTGLMYAVENGLKAEGAQITKELLQTEDAMNIVNQMLIPALDKAGEAFEQGKIFLPQLILSAGVAQAAFEVIKEHMLSTQENPISKGIIVLATVKGDIHDIGKNIVKVLLENYGYTVIDLGKDVEYQAVVDAVKEYDCKLVGLSALMTTTLVSMENTIALLRKNHLDCKVMVGGAVLTPEYAKQIGADFYSKDAKESVDIAKRVLGN